MVPTSGRSVRHPVPGSDRSLYELSLTSNNSPCRCRPLLRAGAVGRAKAGLTSSTRGSAGMSDPRGNVLAMAHDPALRHQSVPGPGTGRRCACGHPVFDDADEKCPLCACREHQPRSLPSGQMRSGLIGEGGAYVHPPEPCASEPAPDWRYPGRETTSPPRRGSRTGQRAVAESRPSPLSKG